MRVNNSSVRLRCPACAYTISVKEQQVEKCDQCGKKFSLEELLTRSSERASEEAADNRDILAQRLAAVLGTVFILAGVVLISYSGVGLAQLASEWGVTLIALTIAAIIRWRINEEPLYPVLLSFGIVWLLAGFFLWAYL